MTHGEHHEPEPKPDLLEFWAGEPAGPPAPPPSGLHWLVQALLAVATLAVILLLAKYAIDILLILVGLGAVGVVLHVIGERVVQSNFLSPGWIWPTVIAVGVGLFIAYPVFAPDGAASLSALRAEGGRGLLRLEREPRVGTSRALHAARDGACASGALQHVGGVRSVAGRCTQRGTRRFRLTASSPTSRAGQRVVFTAWLDAGENASEVAFYDGDAVIGAGTVITQGTGRVAYLQVTTLKAGVHDITASISAGPSRSARRSAPVRVTVQVGPEPTMPVSRTWETGA